MCKFHKRAGFGAKENGVIGFSPSTYKKGTLCKKNVPLLILIYFAMQASSAAMMAALSIFLPMKTILLILSP